MEKEITVREVNWLAKVTQIINKVIRKICITIKPMLSLLYELTYE